MNLSKKMIFLDNWLVIEGAASVKEEAERSVKKVKTAIPSLHVQFLFQFVIVCVASTALAGHLHNRGGFGGGARFGGSGFLSAAQTLDPVYVSKSPSLQYVRTER